jgi:hypothetical protein
MRKLLLAGIALAIAYSTADAAVLWTQPGGITNVNQLYKLLYPANSGFINDQTHFFQYDHCLLPNTAAVPTQNMTWNISPYTGIGNGWAPLSTYQIGCNPDTAWGSAAQAKGGEVGYIVDNTSIWSPGGAGDSGNQNQGQDLMFAKGWSTPPYPFAGSITELIFTAEAKVPWKWSGVCQSWTGSVCNNRSTQTLPDGNMGAYQNLQLNFTDRVSGASFYTIAETYDSRWGANPDQMICGTFPQIVTNWGTNDKYSTVYGTSAIQQTVLWNTWKTFNYAITKTQFSQLLTDLKAKCPAFAAASTTPSDYYFGPLFWGTEINVWGTGPNKTCPPDPITNCPNGFSMGGAIRNSQLFTQ